MTTLQEHLQRDGAALSQAVLDEQYRDPFWRGRFGERGRRHADQDSAFHLQYLARALETGAPEIMVRYARWLREVLVTRGMCSRHLAENYRLLAGQLEQRPWPDVARAASYLREAAAALDYGDGEAGDLRRARDRLVDDASRGVPGRAGNVANLASYLEDAIAFDDTALWSTHVAWTARWMERTQGGRQPLLRDLQSLEAAISAAKLSPRALDMLRSARDAAMAEGTA